LRAAFEQHFALVWRSLRRFGVAEGRVDDAVQHVFLTFSARLPKVARASERAFLLSTAVRVAANTRRLDARSREVPSDQLETVGEDCHTPEQLLDWKQRREALDRALDLLPLEQRAVFVLYELEGFSLPEIAHNLGIRLGTATSRLRRARARFEALADGFDLPETGDE
jgi:RNA polymerase sigma-70 factor (ECF subfamily)